MTPRTAMVLAAGLGTRMRPITDTVPKPLVPISGKPLLDWGLDALAVAGVELAVVNVHHLPDQIIAHVARRERPRVAISDERNLLLDSGGGVVKALPLLGREPFYILNADTFWIDRDRSNLHRLALEWDGSRMDILLMLASFEAATGHTGGADFLLAADGRLARARGASEGFIYAGAGLVHPQIFAGSKAEPQSLNRFFDIALTAGRLHGMALDGAWITVGTPEAIAPANAAVARAVGR